MKRLTKRCNGVVTYIGTSNEYETGQIACEVNPQGVRELLDRLAAYEDTGLEPTMCANYKTFEDEAISKGVPFKRIIELMDADKGGRVVVLPCRVGDTVYWVHSTVITECRVHRIQMNRNGLYICLKSTMSHGAFRVDLCLGKNVFFAREEAERALEGEKQ